MLDNAEAVSQYGAMTKLVRGQEASLPTNLPFACRYRDLPPVAGAAPQCGLGGDCSHPRGTTALCAIAIQETSAPIYFFDPEETG